MGRIGLPEMLIIFAIAMLIFGPKKLPHFGRGLGQAIREFKEAMRGGEQESRPEPPEADDRKAPLQ